MLPPHQGHDGVEASGIPGRQNAEDQAHQAGHTQRYRNAPSWRLEREFGVKLLEQPARSQPGQQPETSPRRRQDRGLHQEHGYHLRLRHAQSLEQANLPRAFRH